RHCVSLARQQCCGERAASPCLMRSQFSCIQLVAPRTTGWTAARGAGYGLAMGRRTVFDPLEPTKGSGASRDFGPAKTFWRIEDPQSAKQKCLISSRFPSLTRVPLSASAAERSLLSADAPAP